jgi:hypothetical protein
VIEFRIAGATTNTLNAREHWAVRAKRTKRERSAVARRMPEWKDGALLVVRLTRIAPRCLDRGDNLASAMKGHRDAVASRLRVDDATPLVRWEYEQAKGEAEVVVQIWRAGEKTPPVPTGEARRAQKVPPGKWDKAKVGAFNEAPWSGALPHGQRLRSPPRSGAKAGNPNYVEAYTPPRSTPVDAAKEAEATFAPRACRNCDDGMCSECSGRRMP